MKTSNGGVKEYIGRGWEGVHSMNTRGSTSEEDGREYIGRGWGRVHSPTCTVPSTDTMNPIGVASNDLGRAELGVEIICVVYCGQLRRGGDEEKV